MHIYPLRCCLDRLYVVGAENNCARLRKLPILIRNRIDAIFRHRPLQRSHTCRKHRNPRAFEGKRRVVSFGSRYDYTAQRLAGADPLPDWTTPFAARIERFAVLAPGSVAQVLCTEYDTGTGIGWHRDKCHYDQVFGLSLASACKFRFRRKSGTRWERHTLDAQPRSLYVMTGAARHVWEHSIPRSRRRATRSPSARWLPSWAWTHKRAAIAGWIGA